MERKPIITNQSSIDIKLVQVPLSISEMVPSYRYEFQSGTISEESEIMFNELLEFIDVNQELVVNEPYLSREDYIKGFQKAIALVRLWMDSIYLEENQGGEQRES